MGRGEQLGDLEALVLAGVVRMGVAANGTGVYEDLEAHSERDLSLSAIHVTLRRLEEKGLLRSRVGDPSPRGGRPRRFYRTTPAGARALGEFREMWARIWTGLDLTDPEESS
jgi:DNA-binding PadR family transcriptional regulator